MLAVSPVTTSTTRQRRAISSVRGGIEGAGVLLLVSFLVLAGEGCKPADSAKWLTAPSRPDHDGFFPIQSGPHAVDCNSCHGKTDSFVAFDCVTCHAKAPTGSGHPGLAKYTWESPACYACHPRGVADFKHDFFPVGPGDTHALGKALTLGQTTTTLTCATCHTAPAEFAAVDCTSCHSQPRMTTPAGRSFHESVADLPADFAPGAATSARCVLCHGDGKVPASVTYSTKAPAHDTQFHFRVAPGNVHAGSPCLVCHSVTKPDAGATAALLADFSQETCTSCHSKTGSRAEEIDAKHAGLGAVNGATYHNLSNPPTPADSRNCLSCHPDGTRGGNFDHAKWFPISANATHAIGRLVATVTGSTLVGCDSCHRDPAVRQNVTCTACHAPSGANGAGPKAIDLAPAHRTQLGGAAWHASTTPTPQCQLCHALDFLERASVHGAGSTATYASDAPGKTFAIARGGHFAGCEKCHDALVENDPDLKLPRIDFNARSCNGCHSESLDKLVTIHNRISVTPAVADTTDAAGKAVPGHAAQCLTCHPDGGPAPSTVAYSHPFFPVDAASTHGVGTPAVHEAGAIRCASCHPALAQAPEQVDCTACHAPAQMKTASGASYHAAVPDLVWPTPATPRATSFACLECHSDSKVPASVGYSTTSTAGAHSASNPAIKFGIGAGSVHDTARLGAKMTCAGCHTQRLADPTVAGLSTIRFKEETCTSCHSKAGSLAEDLDALHAGLGTVSGATYATVATPPSASDTRNCLKCHADGAVGAFDHSQWFPINAPGASHLLGRTVTGSAGATVLTACKTCHIDSTRRENVACTACHSSTGTNAAGPGPVDLRPAHLTKLAGTNWQSAGTPTVDCQLCHALDFLERANVHGAGSTTYPSDAPGKTFVIESNDSNHFVACEQCHTAQVPVTAQSVLKDPQTDFTVRTCNGCHTEARDKLVTIHGLIGVTPTVADTVGANGVPVADHARQCLSCHPSGGAAPATVTYSHPYFPVAAGTSHQMGTSAVHVAGNIACASCHTALTTNPSQIDCTSCHSKVALTTTAGVSFHAAVPDVSWPTPGTPQATSLACLTCHADAKAPVQVGLTGVTFTPDKGAHSAANLAIRFPVTAGAVHDTASTSVAMACLTCHPATQPPAYLVPGYSPMAGLVASDFTQQSCTTCHLLTGTLKQDMNALHAGLGTVTVNATGYTYATLGAAPTTADNRQCLGCHADGLIPAAFLAKHASFFPLGGSTDSHRYGQVVQVGAGSRTISCSSCHVDTANRRNVDCTGCHLQGTNNGTPSATVPADQATAHSGLVGTTGSGGVPDNLWSGTGSAGAGAGVSARCVACHAVDAAPPRKGFVAGHGTASTATGGRVFPVASGGVHFVSCDQCHAATTAGDGTTGPLNPKYVYGQAKCTPCHVDPATNPTNNIVTAHASIPYVYGSYNCTSGIDASCGAPIASYAATDNDNAQSAGCLGCHPTGAAATGFTHTLFPRASAENSLTGTATAFGHLTVAKCGDCHVPGQPFGPGIANITCRGCHNDTNKANQNGATLTARHTRPTVGVNIWTVSTGWSAAPQGSTSATDSSQCLACHAGNNVSSRSASRLVMRLSGHDGGCSPSQPIGTSSEHSVNGVGDNAQGLGVPVCYVCHNATVPSGMTWSQDWAKVTNGATGGCTGCHEHSGGNPRFNACP